MCKAEKINRYFNNINYKYNLSTTLKIGGPGNVATTSPFEKEIYLPTVEVMMYTYKELQMTVWHEIGHIIDIVDPIQLRYANMFTIHQFEYTADEIALIHSEFTKEDFIMWLNNMCYKGHKGKCLNPKNITTHPSCINRAKRIMSINK